MGFPSRDSQPMDALSRDELPFAGFFADVARLVLLPLTLIVMLLFARQKPPRCSNRPWAAPLPRWSPLNRWEKAADSAANVAAASLAAGDNDKSMLSLLPSQPAVECACALQLVPVVVDATQAPPAEALPSTSAPTVLPCNGNGNGQYTALSSAMALSVSSPVVASVASRIDKSNGNHTNPTSERLSSPPPYRPSLLSPSFANLHSSLTNNASPELSRQLQPITLVLDLDETLVHSSLRPLPDADFFVETQLDRGRAVFHVIKRPFMHQFLEPILSWPEYRVAFFPASLRAYAEPVMDVIDPLGRISLRYFRTRASRRAATSPRISSVLVWIRRD